MEDFLSTKNTTLCFNKDDFLVKDFSVDKFVCQCRKCASLEAMLEDLGLYHKILCCSMIELINKDYVDFVNLSSNLVGLDKSIKNLSLPLEKLEVEIEGMKCNLNETLTVAKTKFAAYNKIYNSKVLTHHALCVLEGLKKIEDLNCHIKTDKQVIPSDVFERIALEYNLVQFHMGKIDFQEKMIKWKKMDVLEAARTLREHLEKLFIQSLSSSNDTRTLTKVLRIYSVINKEREVEAFFRQTIVKPYMKKCLSEENILKHGLSKVYDDILVFVSKHCGNILDVTRGTRGMFHEMVPGYDFLVNSVWPEIVHSFELIAPVHVYAPGDPQLFHANYTASLLFLEQFEHYCEVQTSVKRLRNHSYYKSFMGKWNLDVYFQIRFQEIAGHMENSLLRAFDQPTEQPSRGDKTGKTQFKYMLNATFSVSHCIKLCWDKKILLKSLCYNFWRLTLQLIARYAKWANTVLNQQDKHNLSPVEFAVIIKDVEQLVTELKLFFNEHILACVKNSKVAHIVEDVFLNESIKSLEDIIILASSRMIESLSIQCCSHLKLITDIPRLFRKTNREIPTKPSNYVGMVFSSLTAFLSEIDSILSEKLKKICLEEVTNNIISEALFMIQDVLTSIKKMEDSLKILKRARDKPLGQVSSGTFRTDDDKIRHQLAIDINYLEEGVKMLGIEISKVKSFKELKTLKEMEMSSCEKAVPESY